MIFHIIVCHVLWLTNLNGWTYTLDQEKKYYIFARCAIHTHVLTYI